MSRFFGIVPAAGHSTRMGEPKLLLPLGGSPLISHTLDAWRQSRVNHVIAVVRPGDEALAKIVRNAGVELVIPATPPPDMKASIQAALRHIAARHFPVAADAFLVAPADMPRLSPAIIDALIQRHAVDEQRILVPTIAGQRGHPVLFPWDLASEAQALADNEGLDVIVRRHEPLRVSCDAAITGDSTNPFTDVDTPEDYRRLSE
jgi:molybdenum cofactor cytidylyltransferase